jgi:hypothetical protein
VKSAIATALALTLVAAAPVAGKMGTTATLLNHPRFDAKPGTEIVVSWKLGIASAQAARTNPGGRYYVRLFSKTGARSTHAFGKLRGRHYTAKVRVPRGGAGDMEIRLVGWVMAAGEEPRRADMAIPITNDPFEPSGKAAQAR